MKSTGDGRSAFLVWSPCSGWAEGKSHALRGTEALTEGHSPKASGGERRERVVEASLARGHVPYTLAVFEELQRFCNYVFHSVTVNTLTVTRELAPEKF